MLAYLNETMWALDSRVAAELTRLLNLPAQDHI